MNPRSLSHYLGVSYFVAPLPLLAVLVLLLNDHYLKAHHSSWLTGKLSDFAGLFFFPIFLCALICLARNLWRRDNGSFAWISPQLLVFCIVLTDFLFIAIKINAEARAFYIEALGGLGLRAHVVPDLSDLWALTMGPLTFAHARPFWRYSL